MYIPGLRNARIQNSRLQGLGGHGDLGLGIGDFIGEFGQERENGCRYRMGKTYWGAIDLDDD